MFALRSEDGDREVGTAVAAETHPRGLVLQP
jgi:hypothetical protein